jgi:hypothetical protein
MLKLLETVVPLRLSLSEAWDAEMAKLVLLNVYPPLDVHLPLAQTNWNL